jgi:SAM-dependent methyltransferase
MSHNIYEYVMSKLRSARARTFEQLRNKSRIFLYAGHVPEMKEYKKFVGLSLSQSDGRHIHHDVTQKHPLRDDCVDVYQSEDVFEHISYDGLPVVVDEIYRILKPGGVFRLSLPDYRCDLLFDRSIKDAAGNLQFDPEGGGQFVDGKVVDGGHVWFPRYESVKQMLDGSRFKKIVFLHYYDEKGQGITNPIDYSIGFVQRTPDHDERVRHPYRPMSLVVDCTK